jgi:pyochelin biosynthetic protein PchC
VCFPHAGGSATFYRPVACALAPGVDALAVQYPGRQDRRHEPCLDTIPDLADAVLDALLPALDRPFALFGHSMGALVAFEVATRMRARSLVPAALFVSGRRAPSSDREENLYLDDDALLAEIRSLDGTHAQLLESEELLRMVLPAIRADFRAAATYRPPGGEPLTIPIHVHVGDRDPKVDLAEAHAWRNQTTGRFTLTTYPGGHFYLSAHVPALVAAIAAELPAAG